MSVGARRLVAGLAGATAAITALTLLSRVVGFGRWFAQNAWVGPNEVGTAYATANSVPNVLYEVAAGGALAGAVIPLLAAPLAARMRGDVDRISSALLGWALVALVPLAVVTALLARPVATLLLSSRGVPASQEQVELATTLLRIFAPQIPLYGIGVVLTGVLQAQKRFLLPACAPLASSVVVIASYYAFGLLAGPEPTPGALSSSAVAWLGWGTTAGVAAMSLPLLVPVVASGVRLRPALRFPPGVAPRARRLAASGIGTLLAQQASVVVAVVLANRFGQLDGTVSVYQYSQAVYLLPYAVLAVPLATAMFPRLAEHASARDSRAFARDTSASTRAIVVAALAGAAGLVAAADPVQTVFATYARGDVSGMAGAVTAMAPGLVGMALLFHLSRALYALEHARAAVVATSIGWVTVAVASWVAVMVLAPDGDDGPAALLGLGIGTAVGMTVAAIALAVAVRRVAGSAALAGIGRTTAVALGGAVVGALAGRLVAGSIAGPDAGAGVALLAGLVGGVLALAAVGAASAAADRSLVAIVRRA
ncbi:virulence factor MVIN family protein [Beutenbergia cavernae DSM 12333]|uniref:Virulence factor MVIN family protein n=1 Tax=Beutenbergia cavernae (strain ATCC BAA-8 / DSM 12333 / CCUG 43141 / JCM 11478 / NBRC 16432 / NCIMB 13614 / HKI 0122) TaxID=471853 RepID=C5BW00_BEUC1|nr:lipid II flippase MurJ [Beutenbergia cavernae]ACQ80601.1 virulence factor MVIN family protein [Beutenbergia cavernae DSM 12333]